MGNLASVAIRNSATATALPSDAFVIDCDWLEATHPHFQLKRSIEQQQQQSSLHEPAESTMARLCQRSMVGSSWMRSAVISCRNKLLALVSKPTALVAASTERHDACAVAASIASYDIADNFFDEFHQVFELRTAVSKPASAWNSAKLANTKSVTVYNNDNDDNDNDNDNDDDDDNFEDCVSYTTDATDSLSESECESACFVFCGGRECEAPSCRANEPQDDSDTDCDSNCSDDDDSNNSEIEDDDDCLARAERLTRMVSASADVSVYLDDYLCSCGECPQYKLIAYEVQRYGTYANDAEKRSLTRILQAFSTYNEAVGYDCDMIPTAEECLEVWRGDEDQAFRSFVTLFDDVPHLCN